MFSGSIAVILPKLDLWIVLAVLPERVIAAILPETNLHVKSVLQQYCGSIARLCCSDIAAIGSQKPCILVRENLFALLYY